MKRSAWAVTAVLVVLAGVSAWFFGLDPRHAVVLVGAAFAAGIANGLLDAVDVPRARLTPLPVPVRGLAEIQALEFSLSSADPGMRAVLEVHGLAADAARARPDVPRSPSFDAFVAQSQPAPLDHRTLRSLADELERIVLSPRATDAAPSPSNNSQETR
ncbi:hypothetical protein [Arthrobacter sp. N1]|uniref:hypothetical protein n=1 Tax=Arthrobacter sp. N1 TaxID=619291 RepID=UPI003BAE5FC9